MKPSTHTSMIRSLLRFRPIALRIATGLVVSASLLLILAPVAEAVSSWNPTLLVNTESFHIIDVGDGTTNIELKFGSNLDARIIYDRTNSQFKLTKPLYVQGNITATGALSASGSIRTDADLTINDDQGAADAILTFGQPTTNQTLKYLNSAGKFQFSRGLSVIGHLSGSSLNVDRNATVGGALTASGTIRTLGTITGSSLTINRNGNFGGIVTASGGIRTRGNLSGSSLTIDGGLTVHGLNYTLPASRGSSNTFLREDGAGALTWAAITVGNGSGEIMSLHPIYPNSTYSASGSNSVGQLSNNYDSTNKQNFYRWTSTKSTIQDYWIAARVRIPDNFSSWDPVKPIELRYRTGSGLTITNHLTMRVLDTTGTEVSLTGGGALANINWTTATITGPQASGTWTAKGFMTILLKLAALTPTDTNDTGAADAGYINLNWETTTP